MDAIAAEKANGKVGWRDALSGGEHQNFRRLVLGVGTSIFQQMGGINVGRKPKSGIPKRH